MQGLERARRVERTAHSKTWLVEVWEQILMDRDAHTAAGFPFVMCALMDRDGFVWLQVIGEPGPDAAEAYFRDRYGDAVWVEWLAAQRHVERPRGFGSWTAAGRILRVYSAIDRNGERRGSATLRSEDSEEIVVAVTCFVPLGPRRLVGGYKPQYHDIELAGPVAGRRVIDAATGKRRRSLAEIPFH
ncbi:MAG: hypothetical protein ABW060_09610 [Solirubrobacteraceae bacterium]